MQWQQAAGPLQLPSDLASCSGGSWQSFLSHIRATLAAAAAAVPRLPAWLPPRSSTWPPSRSVRQQRGGSPMPVGEGSPPCGSQQPLATFQELAISLLRPCSVFDADDSSIMQHASRLLRQCRPDQAQELQRAFFESSDILTFLLARLTGWGVLMRLYRLGQGAGAASLHTTPCRLLRRLALTAGSSVCFRAVMDAARLIAERHGRALQAAATHHSSSSCRTLNQAYYADPLHLSHLSELPYLFVSVAHRMLGSGRGCEAASLAKQHARQHDDDDAGAFSSAKAPHPVLLRWERLVGRLAAQAADCKARLLLDWLALQLSFGEGSSSCCMWLSDKVLSPSLLACASGDDVATGNWTFGGGTQQLVACLLMLHLGKAPESSSSAQAPADTHDLLWWAREDDASSEQLDSLVAVLFALSSMSQVVQQQQAAGGSTGQAGLLLPQVVRQLPDGCVQSLLCRLFARFACAMCDGGGGMAVPAYRCGSVLAELLTCVPGAAELLAAAHGVEAQHLLPGALQRSAGGDGGVLGRLNAELLHTIAAACTRGGGAVCGGGRAVQLTRATCSVLKVQN